MQDQQTEEINRYITALKNVDAGDYLDKEESEIWPVVQDAVTALTRLGPAATTALSPLLDHDFTWSCYYALRIFHQTKDPQAIPALIGMLCRESDDTLACEEAMFTLQDIGTPAIQPLLDALKDQFDNEEYNSYMVGALTGIPGQVPYDYMKGIVTDYLQRPARYHGWFNLGDFIYNFTKQQNKDALPLLRQILLVKGLDGPTRQEILETIEAIETGATEQ